jgi:N-acyl-D-aspartate/D-glutamate deacylase
MDLDALRAGINWQFQSFAEYMTMLRGRGAYMNLGVLVGAFGGTHRRNGRGRLDAQRADRRRTR